MGDAIFLSAGVPDPKRGPEFAQTADTVAITAAVSALVHVTLGRHLLVWGGQPAITPMVWAVAEALGVDYGVWVKLYQTRHFEDEFPEDNERFQNITYTEDVQRDREKSLRVMRDRMLTERRPPCAGRLPLLPLEDLRSLSTQIEHSGVCGSVVQFKNQSPTRIHPPLLGLPHARVESRARIVGETARTGVEGLLESAEQSVSNPRLSPDRRWIAFDASRPGEPANVCVSPFQEQAIREAEWVVVDRAASHPFWSADGRFLYYVTTCTNPLVRSAVRARHFSSASGLVEGEPMAVYASTEMLMPAYLPGAAPIATPDQIILVLGDFRGDIWLMDLEPHSSRLVENGP